MVMKFYIMFVIFVLKFLFPDDVYLVYGSTADEG